MNACDNSLHRSLHCPLCEADNHCAVAAGSAPESCWCHATTFDPAVLAAVPEDQRNQRCLCPACAVGSKNQPAEANDK